MFEGWNKNIKNAKLTGFRYSSGGGMAGGGSVTTIGVYDETRAVVTFTEQEWHNSKPVIKKYLTDIKILSEIEEVFRENNMQKWDNKKFTDVFVCDGPNYSYGFTFDNRESINFSSQLYPEPYSEKLKEISDVIDNNREFFKKHR